MADDKRIAVLAADAFQDSEYFLPKVAIEKLREIKKGLQH